MSQLPNLTDQDSGKRAVELMRDTIEMTYTPEVLSDTGNFGGLYDAAILKKMQSPVLVASTDGIGSKTKVAARLNRWGTIGQCLVNHCVNDILVQGARPLFFLDYIAADHLHPEQIAIIVSGMAHACLEAGCALIGGETAEIPGIYAQGEVDVAGTIVGIVEQDHIIDGRSIAPGDLLFGLPSTGIHSNGYTLACTALDHMDWEAEHPDLGETIGDALLAVHRSYLREVQALQRQNIPIKGLAHITGGGLFENIPRILPPDVGVRLQRGTWPELPIFHLIQAHSQLSDAELFSTFNMGIGLVIVVAPDQAQTVVDTLGSEAYLIGQVETGHKQVTIEAF